MLTSRQSLSGSGGWGIRSPHPAAGETGTHTGTEVVGKSRGPLGDVRVTCLGAPGQLSGLNYSCFRLFTVDYGELTASAVDLYAYLANCPVITDGPGPKENEACRGINSGTRVLHGSLLLPPREDMSAFMKADEDLPPN